MLFHTKAIHSTILILAGALLTGCGSQATAPQVQVDDTTITNNVKAKLKTTFGPIERREAHQMERGAGDEIVTYIDVSSGHGVVTLSGEVRSPKAKVKAEEVAKSVPDVVSVVNQLGVAPGYSDDSMGTAK